MIRNLTTTTICILALAAMAVAQGTVHSEGFETDTGDWQGSQSDIARVASGANGIPSASGNYHLEITDPASPPEGYYSGAYSFLGRSRPHLGAEWSSSLDVYIDLNDSRIQAGTYGFDVSLAMYDSDDNHEQDNIFHVHANDPANDGSYELYVNASHNSNFAVQNNLATSGQPYGSSETPAQFTQSGWYTFEWLFTQSTSDPQHVEVTFEVTDDAGGSFWLADWTTEAYDVSEAGGNGYMWFTFADTDRLAVDNAQVVPEPATMSLLGLGGLALLRRRRRK